MDPPDFPFTQRGKQVNLDLCLTTIRIRDRYDMPVSQKFVMAGYLHHGKAIARICELTWLRCWTKPR